MRPRAWLLAVAVSPACSSAAATGTSMQCTGDATACITGTATVQGFSATPRQLQVNLFREFPSTGAGPLTTEVVTPGTNFAFSALPPWAHYYVQVQADFGQPVAPAGFVGPLTVPSAAPVDVQVKPVQLSVLEQSQAGAAMQLQSALAYLFDPSSGAPLQDADISIVIGGTPVPMPWTQVTGGTFGYSVAFAASTPAQSTYTITTGQPGATDASSWQLVADVPTFTPTLSAPANGANVPAGQALTVSWPEQPASDEEIVQLFALMSGAWSAVYQSPAPDDADAVGETLPSSDVGPPGQSLLLNVAFLKGNCPPSADGCVVAEAVAAEAITAQ
jgi:hypothetical protein